MRIGYTCMSEQSDPRWLVRDARAAEEAGFDLVVFSDHYSPWLTSQGHAPYAWSVLGAVTQVTSRVELMTYVTAPTMRYHPAVVAQKAATMGLLSEGRFTLGLGSGENLNEHVVGERWPAVEERQDMLVEALEIIDELFEGQLLTYAGEHFRVDSARLWDLPEQRVPIAVGVSGEKSCTRFAPLADHMIAVEPDPSFGPVWDGARTPDQPAASRRIGQLPVCWDADRDAAIARAHDQFRWFAGGWKVNADLPTTAGFSGATQFVRPEDVAEAIPCGDDVDAVVEAASAFFAAGFTDLALVQVGGEHQQPFLEAAQREILPALREAAASNDPSPS
ncbi:TIGR03557 family F420-dependent LLM class oxidoreductase [Kineococcus sp. SYSU DK004]|uniref:TIGR03557 family F420-dependent LLM class oxidoreductase n=1 Tax=Kineococcus sp. SYSU DK004 TaxID=3383125 RepID=UPI003D7E92FA